MAYPDCPTKSSIGKKKKLSSKQLSDILLLNINEQLRIIRYLKQTHNMTTEKNQQKAEKMK